MGSRWAQDGLEVSSRSAHDELKTGSRWAQDGLKMGSRWAQTRSTWAQKHTASHRTAAVLDSLKKLP
jgi:hypothetical protein